MAHHYQRLHDDTQDLEQGSEPSASEEQLDTHESSPLLKTFYSLSSSLSSFSSSLFSHYSPQKTSSILQRPIALAFLLLLTTSAFFATWFISTVPVARTLDQPSLFNPAPDATHYQLWPPQGNAGRDESLRYTLIPFLPTPPASNITPGPQSPPQNIPLDALDILFDPSSLPRVAASGFRLPPDLEAFFNQHTTFDIVWTWVNGSDPLHRQALEDAEKSALTQRRRALEARSGLPFVEPAAAEIDAAIIARSVAAPKLFRYVVYPVAAVFYLPFLLLILSKTCANFLASLFRPLYTVSTLFSYAPVLCLAWNIGIMMSCDIHYALFCSTLDPMSTVSTL
jgi:hypothetical protein